MPRLLFTSALLFTVALLAATPASAVDVPHYAEFHAWFVACDNLRSCEARGFEDAAQADLRLLRAAGDAPAELRLTAAGDAILAGLALDGTPLQAAPPWSVTRQDGVTTMTTKDAATVAAFLQRARNGHRLSFGAGPGGVPLDGLTAALMRIDDVQGREGTSTALLAPRGPGSPPEPPALPPRVRWSAPVALASSQARSLARAVRHAQATALAKASCTQRPDEPDEAFALDAERALVILPCSFGAYQGNALVFIITRADGRAGRFAPRLPTLADPVDTLVNAGFDPGTGTLSMSAKGRGVADCGMMAEWAWADGGFRLVEMARQDACGGAEPGDWPVLFRTAPGGRPAP